MSGVVKVSKIGCRPIKVVWKPGMTVRDVLQAIHDDLNHPMDYHLEIMGPDRDNRGPVHWDTVEERPVVENDHLIIHGRMLGDGPGVTEFYRKQVEKYGLTPAQKADRKGGYHA